MCVLNHAQHYGVCSGSAGHKMPHSDDCLLGSLCLPIKSVFFKNSGENVCFCFVSTYVEHFSPPLLLLQDTLASSPRFDSTRYFGKVCFHFHKSLTVYIYVPALYIQSCICTFCHNIMSFSHIIIHLHLYWTCRRNVLNCVLLMAVF